MILLPCWRWKEPSPLIRYGPTPDFSVVERRGLFSTIGRFHILGAYGPAPGYKKAEELHSPAFEAWQISGPSHVTSFYGFTLFSTRRKCGGCRYPDSNRDELTLRPVRGTCVYQFRHTGDPSQPLFVGNSRQSPPQVIGLLT